MAAPVRPPATKAFKRERLIWVPAIADINAPKLTELTAASALDLSCTLFDSFARPSQTTNGATLERRVCDGEQYEQAGITSYTGGEMPYALNPQDVAGGPGKVTWEKFVDGASGFLVRRLAVDVETDLAVGDFVDVFPVEVGPSMPTTVGEGESREVAGTATVFITSKPAFLKAIVA